METWLIVTIAVLVVAAVVWLLRNKRKRTESPNIEDDPEEATPEVEETAEPEVEIIEEPDQEQKPE